MNHFADERPRGVFSENRRGVFRTRLAIALVCLLAALTMACAKWDKELETTLCRSLNNYIYAIRDLDQSGLEASVYFPNVGDYRAHVRELLADYLDRVATGEVEFDRHGVILTRFLGLGHHRYLVRDVKTSEDKREAWLRIGVHFAYDSNIAFADMEPGTEVYVPGKPWGSVHVLTIGGENPAPREQLSYVEIVVYMRQTNVAGQWQVRTMEVDTDSIEYEISLKTDF